MAHASKTVDEKLEDAVPRVSMDYFFMSKKDEKANEHPMLVAVDESTGEKFARTTGKKGVEGCDWLIKEVSEELRVWGHAGGTGGKIILKCDGGECVNGIPKRASEVPWGSDHTRGPS